MQVDILQMGAAVAAGPALLLLRTLTVVLVPVWLEALRLRHRQRLVQTLPAGSVLHERYAQGGSVRIQVGPAPRARRSPRKLEQS